MFGKKKNTSVDKASGHSQEQVKPTTNEYKGLPALLHKVRWTQHFFAILAEVLILIALFASGMDLGVGGVMANAPGLKWAWAAIFALGVDTSFVVSWVRCRQIGWSWHLLWCIPVALGMSFVVFEPTVIQLMQASLNVSFADAVSMLGINIVFLVYARSLIAVVLGAVLALTNVESQMKSEQVGSAQKPKRRLKMFDTLLNKYAPIVSSEQSQDAQVSSVPAQVIITEEPKQELKQIESKQSTRLHLVDTSPKLSMIEQRMYDAIMKNPQEARELERLSQEQSLDAFVTTLQQKYSGYAGYITPERVANVMQFIAHSKVKHSLDLLPIERVKQVLTNEPACSDRELGRLAGMSAATAKKYKKQIEQEQSQAM